MLVGMKMKKLPQKKMTIEDLATKVDTKIEDLAVRVDMRIEDLAVKVDTKIEGLAKRIDELPTRAELD